jgi:FO synthase
VPATRLPSLASPSAHSDQHESNAALNAFVPDHAEIRAALERVAERTELDDPVDAETLLHSRGADLDALLEIAGRIRDEGLVRAGRPGVITYSRKVFIPLTHLCQDRCHYCIFVQTPGKLAKAGKAPFMAPDEVLEIARAGAALGCKEALFTLGDRPENRWPVAREWLDEHGYESTLDYVRDMAIRVLEETGLLPHLNPGVLTWPEIQRLKPVAPSMGMMLETTATRLWSEKSGAHYGSPDKDPAVRLRVLDDAGRSRVPFTTGVLLGIGENYAERVDAMFAIRASERLYGHVQEVIVQNFRAKEATAMMRASDLETQEYAAAVAVTRLVMGPTSRIQVPPNLTDANELSLLVRAGIDDWGGVSPLTPDHVNPERPWPQIDELARLTADAGFRLHERLTTHPHYIRHGEPWLDPRIRSHVDALVDAETGLARENAIPVGLPWSSTVTDGSAPSVGRVTPGDSAIRQLLRKAERDPAGLRDVEYSELLSADGSDLEALASVADRLRHESVGDAITFAINRNIDSSLLRDAHGHPRTGASGDTLDPGLTLARIGELADEAWALGATEICMQGAVRPTVPATAYLELARMVTSRQSEIHLHAFRPIEIADGAARLRLSYRDFLEALADAGVDTVPGTGARILDDRIRGILTGNTDLLVDEWVEIIRTAHRVGLRSTATMIYGHVETAAQQVAHLRTIVAIQDETGGFTEFIPMPFMPADAPASVTSVARPGPSIRESRAVHAVSRLMLNGRIDHVQAAWTKLGVRGAQQVLQSGADDLGGILISGALSPTAGAEAGRELTTRDVLQTALEIGRPTRQRTTTYGAVPPERIAAAERAQSDRTDRTNQGPPARLQLPVTAR